MHTAHHATGNSVPTKRTERSKNRNKVRNPLIYTISNRFEGITAYETIF